MYVDKSIMTNEEINFTKDEIETLLATDDEAIKKHLSSIAHTADINEFLRQVDVKECLGY